MTPPVLPPAPCPPLMPPPVMPSRAGSGWANVCMLVIGAAFSAGCGAIGVLLVLTW